MKEHLSQLTMKEYIELMCGNDSILLEGENNVSPQQLSIIKRNIIFEYKQIADTSGVMSYLSDEDNKKKTTLEVLLYQMCDTLIRMKAFDEVRDILQKYGLRAFEMSEDKLRETVKSRLNRALSMQKRNNIQEDESESLTSEEIRIMFDKQTSHLMTYFKFQINVCEIGAAIYANMVNQYNREIKEKMALLKK